MSASVQPVETGEPCKAHLARSDQMERIAHFVLRHEIDITGANLSIIANALTGSDPALARVFVAREISGEPIDQNWIDSVTRREGGERHDRVASRRMQALEQLMDRMEGSLTRFSDMTRTAKDQTSEHRGALDAQLEQMTQCDNEESALAELDRVIDLSRAMVDRITQIEGAMERSQAETSELRASLAEARNEADIDHLTNLPNRRAFERRLTEAAQRAQELGRGLCVAFCDVDNFKAINDTHGHDAGDRVLVALANMLKTHASRDCFVARHGGEEFVLLFEGADKDSAWRKLDGIRRVQAAKRMINRDTGKSFGLVTFSGGVAEVKDTSDTRKALARADEALYKAKSEGRNRIIAV